MNPNSDIETAISLYKYGHRDDAHAAAVLAFGRLPGDLDSLLRLGDLLVALGDLGRAVAVFEEAVDVAPDRPEPYNRLAATMQQRGPIDTRSLHEMLALLDEALAIDPDYADAQVNRAVILHKLHRTVDARNLLLTVTGPVAETRDYHNILCVILQDTGDDIGAIDHARRAIELDPGHADAYFNWGTSLYHLCQWDDALDLYSQTFQRDPNHARAHAVKGMIDLLHGRFAEGWAEYEWRLKCEEHQGTIAPALHLDHLDGKRVLLTTDQGLGDTIHLVRYGSKLKALGAHVIVVAPDALSEIIATCDGVDKVVSPEAVRRDEVDCDFQTDMMSLPYQLGTNSVDDIPATVPYLFTPQDRRHRWASTIDERTPPGTRLRVGLVWAGSPTHRNDLQRSLRLSQLAPILAIDGIAYFALQKGPQAEAEVRELNSSGDTPGHHNGAKRHLAAGFIPAERREVVALGPGFDTMADTAAAIDALDLVISVDTSVAHLAGSLGKPVWTLLPAAPDWRWLLGRDDTPWYPTMRLYRQPTPGDWTTVIARVRDQLALDKS